ncbi:putative c2h2 finger domain containing protein [Golovinomyces cichoracearum]|uniref:Putative c2h2 finger domain containing protein n=1 Tax=Golovinomyces cichoracearum TaxID=62708 RepID=A0A420IFF6_9PEZI|nr:putative c2h2 finger domain containing protein [Golovinomyces cichoracearum]
MSEQKKTVSGANDTDFRKKYDRDEYRARGLEREAKEKEDGKARYEAKLAGRKYYAPLTGNETLTQARASRLDVASNTIEVKRASLEEVHERITTIWEAHLEAQRSGAKTLSERLEIRKEDDEKMREDRRKKRRELIEKRRVEKQLEEKGKTEYGTDVRIEGEHDEEDMMAMMGITGFESSKK